MKKSIIIFVLLIGIVQIVNAQEPAEWKTQTFVTGYFSLNGEYVDLPVFKEIKGTDKGVGIAEASVLTTIRPLEKFKISSVITYKPRLDINGIITELSGEWSFSDPLKFKAGRFLLPLHPANTQYYAPMNIGAALPIFVTNHSLFPLNINGISLNGKIPLSDNLVMGYSLSGGQYTKTSRDEAGILGFFGRDGVYMDNDAQKVRSMIKRIEDNSGAYSEFFGTGGNINLDINDIALIEVAYFYSSEKASLQPNDSTFFETNTTVFNYGANFVLNYNNINMKASAWFGKDTPDDTQRFSTNNIDMYYLELAYTMGTVTPFSKLEILKSGIKDLSRATVGINYRPFFEATIKVEYHRYLQEYVDDFNLFQCSLIYSF